MKTVQERFNRSRIWSTLMVLVMSLGATTASADSAPHLRLGGESSGGGDGRYVNGDLILRDFLETSELVLDNVEFLKSIPGFEELIHDIGRVQPSFAMAIWGDLVNTQIFITNDELPLLDPEQTGFSTTIIAERQIAYREDKTILISMPALEALEDKQAYLPLHESMHGLLKGSGALHHMRVRTLVKYIEEHRAQLSREDLGQHLEKIGVQPQHFGDRWFLGENFGGFKKSEVIETRRILVNQEGSFAARCAIFNDLLMGPYSPLKHPLLTVSASHSFAGYDECPETENFTLFYSEFPEFKRLSTRVSFYLYLTDSIPTGLFKREDALKACNRYVTQKKRDDIDAAEKHKKDSLALGQKLRDFTSDDPALELYVRAIVQPKIKEKYLFVEGSLKWQSYTYVEDFAEKRSQFRKLEATCSRMFKKNSAGGWSR